MPPRPIEFSDKDRAAIERRYLSGDSARVIALDYHCSSGPIYKALHDMGVEMRTPGGVTRNRLPESEVEYMDWLYWGLGLNQTEIAEALKLKATTISSRFRDHGIPTRERSEINRRVWAKLTPEERTARSRKAWAGLSDEEKERRRKRLLEYSRRRSVPAQS